MRTYDITFRRNRGDYLLSIAAMLQPILTLIQLFMIDALRMVPEATNRIRVTATAIPIVLAMVIVFKRKPNLAIVSYSIVLFILLLTVLAFPDRWQYMRDDVMKLTLPVVVPIGLCIASVRNFAVLIRSMLYVAVLAAFIGILYVYVALSGGFYIEGYSMTFSYALLFPCFVLISKKDLYWKIIGVILILEMLAIGSRGALVVSVAYWLLNFYWGKISLGRIVVYGSLLTSFFLIFWNRLIALLISLFSSVGIKSRTLMLLVNNELISHDSGRDEISKEAWNLIDKSPLLGSGVWADRQYIGGYCHNVFLEMLVDFGYFGFLIIFGVFLYYQICIFKKIPMNHKTMYIMMLSLLVPLLASSSYLTSFNVGMFLGFSYLLSKLNKLKLYQDYQYK